MTPDLLELGKRAVACPRWRWMPGMLAIEWPAPGMGLARRPMRVDDGWPDVGVYLPDLSDPATLGCMLDMVREIHGRSTVIRLVGTDGQGGEEWAICDRAPGGMAASSIYGFASELEALVAALEAPP